MAARVIDGKAIAAELKRKTGAQIEALRDRGCHVRLDAVMVGDPVVGSLYARSQQRHCASVRIDYNLHTLGADATGADVRKIIDRLNKDRDVTGILLNLPLPEHIDTPAMQYAIDPYKDVEGVNPANIGLLFYGAPIIAPCTALAVMEILHHIECHPRGLDVVVVGQGSIAGRPITLFLQHKLATVTACQVETHDLAAHTQNADLLVVAVGKPHLIGAEHVKKGAVVIDVGINRVSDPSSDGGFKIVGDVRYDEVAEIASAITPVPGGVGPVTVAMLLRSAVDAARSQRGPRRLDG